MEETAGSAWPTDRLLWLTFASVSAFAVLSGCVTAAIQGGAPRASVLNIAAWVIGAGMAAGVSRLKATTAPVCLGLALAVLALTLVSPGLAGVHRWIGLGPIRLNSAELLLPIAITACAGSGSDALWRLLFPGAAAVVLALQPDRSQSVALLGAFVPLLIFSSRPLIQRLAAAAILLAALLFTFVRPDPLAPAPEVEGIIGLAWALSPVLAMAAIAALSGVVLTPLVAMRSRKPSVQIGAAALTAYLVLSALAPTLGAYPVPLVGMGISPILGVWFAIGWLMCLIRNKAELSKVRGS